MPSTTSLYRPEDVKEPTMNAEWHSVSINFALQSLSTVTTCAAVLEAIDTAAPAWSRAR